MYICVYLYILIYVYMYLCTYAYIYIYICVCVTTIQMYSGIPNSPPSTSSPQLPPFPTPPSPGSWAMPAESAALVPQGTPLVLQCPALPGPYPPRGPVETSSKMVSNLVHPITIMIISNHI